VFDLSPLFSSVSQKNIKIKLDNRIASLKQEIKKHIPTGTTIEDARRIMEANGFKCQLMERSFFAEREEDDHPLPVHSDIDFLYCDKEKGGLFCDRRWQVAIVHEHGIVSDVFVSIGRICL
jgi:hypothetical protein